MQRLAMAPISRENFTVTLSAAYHGGADGFVGYRGAGVSQLHKPLSFKVARLGINSKPKYILRLLLFESTSGRPPVAAVCSALHRVPCIAGMPTHS